MEMSKSFMRTASLLAVIAAFGTGAYVLGQHDGITGMSFWSPSTASAQQAAKSVPSPVEPLAEQDVYYPGTEAIGFNVQPPTGSIEEAQTVTCWLNGEAKIGPKKNCFYDCLGRKTWIVIPAQKKCPLKIRREIIFDQLSMTEQVPTGS